MPHLTLPNYCLHYITSGNPRKPPLLLLHGFLGSHQDFAEILLALSDHFYCITPDLPGHGQTSTSAGYYTFPATAIALLNLLDHLNISQTHLLGYSMGGRLALYLVCYFPERFIRVVLESASPGLKTAVERQERVERDRAIAHQLETLSLADFLQQWYNNPLFESLKKHPNRYVTLLHRRQNNNATELANALLGLSTGHQPSLWDNLAAIANPLLLLAGELDTKFITLNRDMACDYQLGRTSPVMKTFKNCGHNVHLEAPADYIQAVIHFLDDSF